MKHAYAFALLLPVAGCYSVNQTHFEAHVAERIHVLMPLNTAVATLTADGFKCDGVNAASATVTCTKTRQSLLPTTCIERVNLKPGAQPGSSLAAIDVPPIVCAGL